MDCNGYFNSCLGRFIYIEASNPRQGGDVALMESPEYPASTRNQCFAFYYHMFGDHIGELNVYIQQGIDNDLVFRKNDTQGDMWHEAEIHLLPMTGSYKVIFLRDSFFSQVDSKVISGYPYTPRGWRCNHCVMITFSKLNQRRKFNYVDNLIMTRSAVECSRGFQILSTHSKLIYHASRIT